METKNIMIVGVGGQGSLLASKLLVPKIAPKPYTKTGGNTICRE